MNPNELAAEVEGFIKLCTARITGVGAEQYHVEGKPQKFETMEFDALAEYYEEELRDIANYAAMSHIRLARVRAEFKRRMDQFELKGDLEDADHPGWFKALRVSQWQLTCGSWADKTFEKSSPDTILSHLTEEILELRGLPKPHIAYVLAHIHNVLNEEIGAVTDHATEAADVFLLLLHYCHKMGINLEHVAKRKFNENRQRTWNKVAEPSGHFKHVEPGIPETQAPETVGDERFEDAKGTDALQDQSVWGRGFTAPKPDKITRTVSVSIHPDKMAEIREMAGGVFHAEQAQADPIVDRLVTLYRRYGECTRRGSASSGKQRRLYERQKSETNAEINGMNRALGLIDPKVATKAITEVHKRLAREWPTLKS